LQGASETFPKEGWVFLENAELRVGFSLKQGGALGWISRKKSSPQGGANDPEENLVNIHDPGRWIQGSYYSGPQPFGKPHPGWPNWPWNPVQAGDVYANSSLVVSHSIEGKSFLCKTVPLQWALKREPAEAVMETRVTLEGRLIHWKQTLTTHRSDRGIYPGRDQELPAVYAIGRLDRLVFGPDADEPGGAIRTIPAPQKQPPPPRWSTLRSAEGWAGLLDRQNQGLGLIQPGCVRFLGGHYGDPGLGGAKDDATGYLAAVRKESLDVRGKFTYESVFVVGSVDEIRTQALKLASPSLWQWRPGKCRDHGLPFGLRDEPLPEVGRSFLCETDDPYWVFPDLAIAAKTVSRIEARIRFHPLAGQPNDFPVRTSLRFETDGQPGAFSEPQTLTFPANGEWTTLSFPVLDRKDWKGVIRGLRWDPLENNARGARVEVKDIKALPR